MMDIFRNYRIILASQSPRRREIMTMAGFTFDVVPAEGEESYSADTPDLITMELSSAKAAEVYERESVKTAGPLLVIGADTVVAYGGEILGKPRDHEDAFRMLRLLSGKTHQVYTGVTLLRRRPYSEDAEKRTFFEKTDVVFHELTDEEIRDYIRTEDPLDKAGSYGIQGIFGKHIRKINGDYYNVVGLPIQAICQELKRFA